jgi:hypothetical protein
MLFLFIAVCFPASSAIILNIAPMNPSIRTRCLRHRCQTSAGIWHQYMWCQRRECQTPAHMGPETSVSDAGTRCQRRRCLVAALVWCQIPRLRAGARDAGARHPHKVPDFGAVSLAPAHKVSETCAPHWCQRRGCQARVSGTGTHGTRDAVPDTGTRCQRR